MGKSTFLTGQPIFSQLLYLISRPVVRRLAKRHSSDRYYKRFHTYDHLVAMLYAIFHKCTSLREVTTGLQVCSNRLTHLGIKYCPRRSTLADANRKRPSEVFEQLYLHLYHELGGFLPDSRTKKHWRSRLYIIDSSTISLFQEILRNVGRSPVNGKRKGGIKAHVLMKATEDVPMFVRFSSAAAHDIPFLKEIQLPEGSIVTFDKGYNDYNKYNEWTDKKVTWVTRLKNGTVQECIASRKISELDAEAGVLEDSRILMGQQVRSSKVEARLIRYWDQQNQREFSFITNNHRLAGRTIAQIYKKRWQIEVLFKRIKQNYPLRYFLGDNENAIRIQIWCALIADLLLKVLSRSVKRRWSFANLASMIRIHLMTYVDLKKFLEQPDKALLPLQQRNPIPSLFDP
jgi:hypothetical protein